MLPNQQRQPLPSPSVWFLFYADRLLSCGLPGGADSGQGLQQGALQRVPLSKVDRTAQAGHNPDVGELPRSKTYSSRLRIEWPLNATTFPTPVRSASFFQNRQNFWAHAPLILRPIILRLFSLNIVISFIQVCHDSFFHQQFNLDNRIMWSVRSRPLNHGPFFRLSPCPLGGHGGWGDAIENWIKNRLYYGDGAKKKNGCIFKVWGFLSSEVW